MKNKIKKILLPFYKEGHKFLLEKWWFRLFLVLYLIALILVPFYLFSEHMDSYLKCYDVVIKIFTWGSDQYNQQFALCKEEVMNAIPLATGYALFGTLVVHYIVQFLFFKIIIDFIMLGNHKKS